MSVVGWIIIGVIAVHFIYDLVELYHILDWKYPPIFSFVKNWGGVLFLLLSGVCATLGRRSVRRGLIVIASGLLISAVTVGLVALGFDPGSIIYFGVLHCLGMCMILWPVFRRLPWWVLLPLGLGIIVTGLWVFEPMRVSYPWLLPLGIQPQGLITSDYFPLFPNLGFFLLGAGLGKLLYTKKESLLPQVSTRNPLVRFFCWFGKHSLPVYMIHQPILFGCVWLIANFL
jgi:uncharacterized membrane protein